jgi:hypothetical protein
MKRNEQEFDYDQPHLDLDKAKRVGNIVLIAVTILLLGAMMYLWITGYYSQKIFYLDGNAFKPHSAAQDGSRTYVRTRGKEKIRVMQEDNRRTVTIRGEAYIVDKLASNGMPALYRVTYPSGASYNVEDQGHTLIARDKNGEWLTGGGVYVNSKHQVAPGEEYYYPSSIVTAAYEQYHEQHTMPIMLIPALFCLGFGWLQLRSERFVLFQFKLSYGLWVENPEPTDAYLVMAKVSGVVGIGIAVPIFWMSL